MISTTLAAALSVSSHTLTVTSAAEITAGLYLYVDQELMQVRSLSGSVLSVRRGLGHGGTPAVAHVAGSVVYASSDNDLIPFLALRGGYSTGNMTDARLHGAVGDGVADDTDAINSAFQAAIDAGGGVFLHGIHRTTAALLWNDPNPRIAGIVGYTTIKPDATTYSTLTVGSGSGGDINGGYVTGIRVEGPSSRPTKTTTAAFVIDGAKFVKFDQLDVSNHDIGYRLINNCYGSSFHNLQALFSTCNVGFDLPKGSPTFHTGSDIPFFNCWLSGAVAAVHIGGSGINYHFHKGQLTVNAHGAAGGTGIAAVILGKDYETETVSVGLTVDFKGIDFEGWREGYAVRGYAAYGNVSFDTCAFLATATGSARALGIARFTDAGTQRVTFRKCHAKGEYGNAMLLTIDGAFSSGYSFTEDDWTNEAITVDNGVSPVAIALNNLRPLLIQRLQHGSVTETPRGRGSYFPGGTNIVKAEYRGGHFDLTGVNSPEGVAGCEAMMGSSYFRTDDNTDGLRRYVLKCTVNTYTASGWVAIAGE